MVVQTRDGGVVLLLTLWTWGPKFLQVVWLVARLGANIGGASFTCVLGHCVSPGLGAMKMWVLQWFSFKSLRCIQVCCCVAAVGFYE